MGGRLLLLSTRFIVSPELIYRVVYRVRGDDQHLVTPVGRMRVGARRHTHVPKPEHFGRATEDPIRSGAPRRRMPRARRRASAEGRHSSSGGAETPERSRGDNAREDCRKCATAWGHFGFISPARLPQEGNNVEK